MEEKYVGSEAALKKDWSGGFIGIGREAMDALKNPEVMKMIQGPQTSDPKLQRAWSGGFIGIGREAMEALKNPVQK